VESSDSELRAQEGQMARTCTPVGTWVHGGTGHVGSRCGSRQTVQAPHHARRHPSGGPSGFGARTAPAWLTSGPVSLSALAVRDDDITVTVVGDSFDDGEGGSSLSR
jgi:hypothetical protein